MTGIILINWNGADDTLACLKSLQKAEGEFFVVVADNASDDDSVQRIGAFIKDNGEEERFYLLPLDENYGFAVGNNKALHFAAQFEPDSYMLLNNDTEVEPEFLIRLLEFASKNPHYSALTPCINYFSEKNIIWECGSDIVMGKRVVKYANKECRLLEGIEYIPVTSISGCALFFKPELLDAKGDIFFDRSFFGEEDLEFSMRMKKRGVKMACVPASVIYHKVGRSRNKMKATAFEGKYYMYYLNRLVVLRLHMPALMYWLIKLTYMPNSFRYFYSVNHSFKYSWKLMMRLYKEADAKYGVSRDDFRALMVNNDYFDKE